MEKKKLIRFLNRLTSPKENKEIVEWLSKNGSEDRFVTMLLKDWDADKLGSVSKIKEQQILDNIHKATLKSQKVNKGKKIYYQFLKIGKVAATFLLLVFSGFFLYEGIAPKQDEGVVAEVPPNKIQKRTEAGEKLRITLPDRSEVIVNSLSTIAFYSDFGIHNREIELEGEAYFSIVPDKDNPFQVRTGTVVTTAVGTAFNVYARDAKVKISLTEGKVNVANDGQTLFLIPGEMASIQDDNPSGLEKGKFLAAQTTLWKEGKIHFQSKPFKEILHTLENWYGVRFKINAFDNRKVTGLFNNESLEDILTGLSFSLGFEYQINQKDVVINF